MLTPKRVLLLVGGLVAFASCYAIYAYFLGGINGLPPLPADFLPGDINISASPDGENQRDTMIRLGFGAECEELRRPFKLLARDKGVVLATGQPIFEEDGRVKLSPFSVAIFGKGNEPFPEINIIKSDFAYVTCDRPVSLPSELANRKVIGVELRGSTGVTIVNNRRTPQKNDDLELRITTNPLFFDDRRNLIWTEGFVKLLDTQVQPHPTTITAKGMELHLSKDASPNRPKQAKDAAAKKKGEGVGGVELLVLRASVDMHLYVDAGDGFPGNGDRPKAKPDPKKPPERSHVVIKTNGPFTYDLTREVATFDSPPIQGSAPPTAPDQVLVSREHKLGDGKKFDQLLCDHLKLHFRKKANPGKGPRDSHTGDKEIETAHATGRPGRDVVLTMDTENLEAYGSELFYHCAQPGTGPKTVLKGTPLHAVKDGHKIEARELHLTGAADKQGNGQQAYAKGPGQIDLRDKEKNAFLTHVLWKDDLVSTKERDGDRVYDVWTLSNGAGFIDEEHKQELHARKIRVWLEPNAPGQGGVKASGGPKQKLHRVEAFEDVHAKVPDLIVDQAKHLLISFLPEVSDGDQLPTLPPVEEKKQPVSVQPAVLERSLPRAENPIVLTGLTQPAALPPAPLLLGQAPKDKAKQPPSAPKKQDEAKKPRQPIHMTANDVVIYVTTLGTRKQLKEMVATGKVQVHQEADEQQKGVEITGELLNLLHDVKGDTLIVFGDSRELAKLAMGETKLWGPKVTINQAKNTAEVDGLGAMEMPSKTSFDGGKPSKKDTKMTIHWNKNMVFDGKYAVFTGGVVGYQDHSSLKCDWMQAQLDRVIVFREGQKGNQGAKVEKILCDRKVYVLDEQRDPAGKLAQASVLECKELNVDNLSGPTRATGPGRLRHLAPGSSDPAAVGRPADAPPPPGAKKEMMLTRIDFNGWMYSNTKAATKNATFRDGVELFHVPSETMDVALDPDKLPKNGFYLRCEQLQMSQRQAEGKTNQLLIGERQVFFRTQEFFGYADVVKFDEAQDQVIFEGVGENLTTLYKRTLDGKQQEIKGRKILYNRKAGTFQLEGGKVISTSRLEAPARNADRSRASAAPRMGEITLTRERSSVPSPTPDASGKRRSRA